MAQRPASRVATPPPTAPPSPSAATRSRRRRRSAPTARPGAAWPLWRRRWATASPTALLAPLPGLGPALRLGPHQPGSGWTGAGCRHDGGLRAGATSARRRRAPRHPRRWRCTSISGRTTSPARAWASCWPCWPPAAASASPSAAPGPSPHALLRRLARGGRRRCAWTRRAERILVRGGRAVGGADRGGRGDPGAPGGAGRRGAAGAVPAAAARPSRRRRRLRAAGAALSLRLGHVQDGLGAVRPGAVDGARGPRSRPSSTPATASTTCAPSRARCARGQLPDESLSRDRPAVARRPVRAPAGLSHALGLLARAVGDARAAGRR